MSGTRHARTALARALSAACVVLLCLFAAGGVTTAAAATAAAERTGSGAPSEPGIPVEGESDPAADPEVRAAVRVVTRGLPGVRQLPRPVFHVKHASRAASTETYGTEGRPTPTTWTARSVVLRC
ncbi:MULTISPECIES: hypothetical protein [unclassified Streptomyces]|uniref:hypothetical protein n=1 Tax=unclassified Streptomyces TaxID=2593676 RepID=UPI002E0E1C93|nr:MULTISPECIES: hypothetical protein [unclassified Streptomyces]WSR27110.1 hypothetical protein OG573_13870 [Streptomyces sp. NBC_01205]